MIVFRLTKGAHRNDLSGRGAEITGGRWNSKGTAMLYTSGSRALAYAEISIRLPLGVVPKDYFLIAVELPSKTTIQELAILDLPANWRSNPHPNSTQEIGDAFVRSGKQLILKVPSAVVPGDFNFLLNPAHPQMKEVKIISAEPFEFDSRIADRN